MKATILWGGTLLGIIGVVPIVQAGGPACSPALHIPLGTAPDACGPGFYATGVGGMCYGPNYWLVPPFPPFNGILPGKAGTWIGAARNGQVPQAVLAAQMAQQRPPGPGYGPGGPGGYPGMPPQMPPGYPGMGQHMPPSHPGSPSQMPPGYPGTGQHMPPGYPGMPPQMPPGYPPGFPPNLPVPGYQPNLPVPGYEPNLPSPGYDPRPVAMPAYGMQQPGQGQSPTAYPVHPYARSPRDFFMWREEMEDRQQRERRPALVP